MINTLSLCAMKTLDQILKIKATVLYILGQLPEGVDYIHLFKMMYFAQQNHLVTYGIPLMEDTFKARKHGPVPELTYKILRAAEKGESLEQEEMLSFKNALKVGSKEGHQVVTALESYDPEELSASDIKVLDACISKFRDIKAFDLSSLSHGDKAWKKANKNSERTGENTTIPLYDIAEAGGASPAMLKVIKERQWIEHQLS